MPPFEIAKAYAFEHVIRQMEKHMEKSARVLLGKDKGEFIAEHLTLKGGGNPTRQAVRATCAEAVAQSMYSTSHWVQKIVISKS